MEEKSKKNFLWETLKPMQKTSAGQDLEWDMNVK